MLNPIGWTVMMTTVRLQVREQTQAAGPDITGDDATADEGDTAYFIHFMYMSYQIPTGIVKVLALL